MGKYCKHIFNGITFQTQGITSCNTLWNYNQTHIPYESKWLETYIRQRSYILNSMINGNIKDNCKNCIYLEEINDISQINTKIVQIDINHWSSCNCSCYYCVNRDETKLKMTNKKIKGQISILKTLEKLKKIGLLDENLKICTHGGEPTLLKEFPNILRFALKNRFSFNMMSNCILYEKLIPQVLKIPDSVLTFSLDAGTRETYKKIKKVDKFDDVVKNIKKYVSELGIDNSDNIISKYIILKGVNDNKEEIDKWLETCISVGIKTFLPSFEFVYGVNNPDKVSIPPHIIELYNYIKTRVKEINPNFAITEYDFFKEKILKYNTYDIR